MAGDYSDLFWRWVEENTGGVVLACPRCPLCDQPPVRVLDAGRQAFCGDEICPVITWDATATLEANLIDAHPIEWRPTPRPEGEQP